MYVYVFNTIVIYLSVRYHVIKKGSVGCKVFFTHIALMHVADSVGSPVYSQVIVYSK